MPNTRSVPQGAGGRPGCCQGRQLPGAATPLRLAANAWQGVGERGWCGVLGGGKGCEGREQSSPAWPRVPACRSLGLLQSPAARHQCPASAGLIPPTPQLPSCRLEHLELSSSSQPQQLFTHAPPPPPRPPLQAGTPPAQQLLGLRQRLQVPLRQLAAPQVRPTVLGILHPRRSAPRGEESWQGPTCEMLVSASGTVVGSSPCPPPAPTRHSGQKQPPPP